MDTPKTNPGDTSLETPRSAFDRPLSRGALLKGVAAAAGVAAATPAARALAASPAARPAAPHLKAPPSGEIVIWDRSGDLFQVFDAVIPAFNKKYPEIKVKHVAVDVDAKLPTTLATGVGVPDGAFYEDNNLPIQAAHYYDLTALMQPYVAGILPYKLAVNTSHGRIVGIPFDLDPGLLYYRSDLLARAGVDAASIATYDDLFAAAQTVNKKLGIRPIRLEQVPASGQQWVEMFANQQGVSMVDAAGKLRLDSAPYLTILQWLKRVRDAGLGTRVQLFTPSDIAATNGGQIAFSPYAIWYNYGIQFLFTKTTGHWRAMPLPAWTKGGARGGVMGGSSFIIPNRAKNPQLAWLWYEFLMFNPAGYRAVFGKNRIYPGGINTLLPSYKPALAHRLFDSPKSLGGQDLWDVAVSAARQIPGTYYYAPWFNQAVSYFGTNIQLLLDGKMAPQQVLTQSAAAIQSKLINRS
jgi:lactose/L-arabinose transport system substrate-binding protein